MPIRPLSPVETAEARRVFGDGLDYARVRLSEGSRFPNLVADVGAALRRQRRTQDNAISLGNTSYFPVRLDSGALRDLAWLMHELVHQWQYQRWGWRYLWQALRVQLQQGSAAYDYGHDHSTKGAALEVSRARGLRLAAFNVEQQGDLARDYYLLLRQGGDTGPWEPFVQEYRLPPPG